MKRLTRLSFTIILSYLLLACRLQAAGLYVDANNSLPVVPYTNWATAARVIQDAVDAASPGDEILVTNGIYRAGGRAVYGTLINRVAVTKPLTLRSVNGPETTLIQGEKGFGVNGPGAVRCVYLTNGAYLVGFTLTNGATYAGPDTQNYKNAGGGLWCESTNAFASNCIIVANSAYARGAGAYQGLLRSCVLSANQANAGQGGGAYSALLVGCTLAENSANAGGGAYGGALVDCTLSGNSTIYMDGGGANSAALTGCLVISNTSTYHGGGSSSCSLSNCRIQANSALWGGGVNQGTLTNCTISANTAEYGGGAYLATLNGCRLDNNLAMNRGGGSADGTLFFCTSSGNRALLGGGDAGSHLVNSTLLGNSASTNGGGAYQSFLTNCSVTDNASGCSGGGVCESALNNCTLTGNSAVLQGGGAHWSSLTNCIVYYNKAFTDANYFESTLDYCCTTPLPADGIRNFTDEPQLASISHLSASSPCYGAGDADVATGTDIDGQLWATPPSVGCDELYSNVVTGPLTVGIVADYTNAVAGFDLNFEAMIDGQTRGSWWGFGDGTVTSNRPYASHRWETLGDYRVVLTTYNDSWPGGISSTVLVHVVQRPTHYVAAESTNAVAPYDSWTTAANDIQAAVDAARVAGALILVSNGLYSTGGRIVDGTLSNRLAVTKPLLVQSVNGPDVTTIRGCQDPLATNGNTAIRCLYLADKAELSGFTLTCGATGATNRSLQETSGGALWCAGLGASVSNCVFSLNSAMVGGGGVASCGNVQSCIFLNNSAQFGGGAWASSLKNCTLNDNHAASGGGVFMGTGDHCSLARNSADYGGGACMANLTACQLNSNSAASEGGGAYSGSLFQCSFFSNSAALGGGAAGGSLSNCTLTYNNAASAGGGTYWCDVNNSLLISNVSSFAGGAYLGTYNNCTLVANSAVISGGGTRSSTLNNCIVYYNEALSEPNYSDSTLNYCCTAPLPVRGANNFTAEPMLASLSHLAVDSPCRGAGCEIFATGVDIDGETWASPSSIGCDELHDSAITGAVTATLSAPDTNVVTGFLLSFQAQIEGRTSASWWDFGDGTVVSNRPHASHAWSVAGDYIVTLSVSNDSHPDGLSSTVLVHVVEQPVHYVEAESTNPIAPYNSWATAANDIQAAVDAAQVAGALVLVSNGVYETGGRAVDGALTNRVAVTKALVVRSVNGPAVTTIRGYQVPLTTNGDAAVRCVYLRENASLVGFTLTGGGTLMTGEAGGGGAFCRSISSCLSNCLLSLNSAGFAGGGAVFHGTLSNCRLVSNSAFSGGGAIYARLNNCELSRNAASFGGGAYDATLVNCTLTKNYGAGATGCLLTNCIVYYNDAENSILSHCCTEPDLMGDPALGNFTNAPLFVDFAGGDLRLQSNSPCINSGWNGAAYGKSDLDGEPRVVAGTIDVGAYEFKTPASVISYAWLESYGLATDGSADYTDPDSDGMNTWQEWRCDTIPTNKDSVFFLLPLSTDASGITVAWSSSSNRTYRLERATELPFPGHIFIIQTDVPGQIGITSCRDVSANGAAKLFYRVAVEP